MIPDLSSFHFIYYFVVNSFNCYVIYVLRSLVPLEGSVIFVLSVLFMDPQRGIFFIVLFKSPALGLCYSLNYDHSEAFRGGCVTFDLSHIFCHLILLILLLFCL